MHKATRSGIDVRQRPEVSVLYPEERQQAIAALVAERGRLAVTAVAEQFGVTTETVRRDLAVLERAGMLRRVHGGAVPAGALTLVEPGLGERHGTRTEAKRAIAAAALDLLPGTDGSIVLDGGTHHGRARRRPARRPPALVVTNSVPIAARLSAAPGITLHVLGGRVRGITQTAVGEATVRALADLRVDVAFLGANGISARARLHHARRGRGAASSGPWSGPASGSSCSPTAASSAASTSSASRPSRTSTSWSPTPSADPGVVAELETRAIEVVVA